MSKVYVASPTAAKNPNQMHSITQQQNTDYLVNLHPNYANSQESRFTTTDPAKINRNDKLQTKEETEVQDNLSSALVVFVERPLVLGLVQPEPSRNVLIQACMCCIKKYFDQ